MLVWDLWKQGFTTWENATAQLLEEFTKSSLVLEPSGQMLANTMKVRAAAEAAIATFWGTLGLSTKRDQERALHALTQIQSRLSDLEEKLATRE
jgi:primosomal protein N'